MAPKGCPAVHVAALALVPACICPHGVDTIACFHAWLHAELRARSVLGTLEHTGMTESLWTWCVVDKATGSGLCHCATRCAVRGWHPLWTCCQHGCFARVVLDTEVQGRAEPIAMHTT